ncbi:MAG: YIP1 family protein [Anaerolineales bacterium]
MSDLKEGNAMTPATGNSAIPTEYGTYSWLEAWRMALTRPNEETFRSLADDPNGSHGRAMIWIAITSAISFLITASVQFLFSGLFAGPGLLEALEQEAGLLLTGGLMIAGVYVCGLPMVVLISALGMLIYSGVVLFIANAFGGEGTFAEMTYALAAFTAPLTLLSGAISWIPLVNCLTIPLGVYSLLLTLLAVKSVNRISWGKTIGIFAVLLLVGALLAVVLGLLIWIPIRDTILAPGGLYGVPY